MKHLKTFESYSDLAEEIAIDLLPKLQKIKDEKGIFTVGMFDNYMEERKANMKLTDEVMSYLVSMGFDFDSDDDSDDYDDEFELKSSPMEYQRDKQVESQLKEFIDFFSQVDNQSISDYQNRSRMGDSDFVEYLKSSKNRLYSEKNNKVYGYLINDYISIIDQIIKFKGGINESLSYSGGNVTKMPIIGQIKTKPIGDFEGTTYDVVEVTEDESGDKYYVCNFWYKDGRVPQIVHEDMVEEFIKK